MINKEDMQTVNKYLFDNCFDTGILSAWNKIIKEYHATSHNSDYAVTPSLKEVQQYCDKHDCWTVEAIYNAIKELSKRCKKKEIK